MNRFIPIIFIILWSTGFVGAKFGLPYAEPFTLLMWRMIFVVPLFFILIFLFKRPKLNLFDASIQGLVGLLIHGVYLGAVFAAISNNMPAGITALFVSLNPIIIGIFSSLILNSVIKPKVWIGLFLGFLGVVIVLYGASSWEGVITIKGLSWLILALIGIVAGTLLQKKYAVHVDLITGSFYQFSSSLLLFAILAFSLESRNIDWNINLILALIWLVLALSVVAVLLLLYMIRNNDATKVASYFYLVPPFAAFWGWLFFDEQWSWLTIVGSCLVVFALIIIRPDKSENTIN